ncbi:MAG: glycosyl hydrolase, partial [Acidobacteriota bacterium]
LKLSGAPTIAFRDIEIQRRESDLVGASFGRGFWILDDYSPLRRVTRAILEKEAVLFPVKRALLYIPATPLAVRGRGYQGSSLFTAPNPPYGAVFTYRLRDDLKSEKETRRDLERKIRKEGRDVPFPGWEKLEHERAAHDPLILLTIRQATGEVVRRLTGPKSQGFQRVAWDLRYPSSRPVNLTPPKDLPPWAEKPGGPRVAPGRYTVELDRLVKGRLERLDGPQVFRVVALDGATLPRQDAATALAFEKQTADLQRRALGAQAEVDRTLDRLAQIRQALLDTPGANPELMVRARGLETRLRGIQKILSGDRTRRQWVEPAVPSILDRLGQIVGGSWGTLQGPTAPHHENYRMAKDAYAGVSSDLRRLIDTDLVRLEDDLEAAGAPWTSGRKVPDPPGGR